MLVVVFCAFWCDVVGMFANSCVKALVHAWLCMLAGVLVEILSMIVATWMV